MPQWIDGKEIARQIQAETAQKVAGLKSHGITPGLAVVLVGEDPASRIYVRSKMRSCEALGMYSEKVELPATSTTEQVLDAVESLNRRRDIHGFLVQVPLPRQVDGWKVLNAVSPEKDADGLHPLNVGRLAAGAAVLKPCTPAGILEVLKRYRVALSGRRAVVIGRSGIVGKPVALMLLEENATVTICHSRTEDLAGVAREADILVVAVGKPALVDDTYVKQGATVIDVGMNRVDSLERIRGIFGEDPRRLGDYEKKGYTLVGDVHPVKVFPRSSLLTPVPGGVGQLTVAMLMVNTVKAAARAI